MPGPREWLYFAESDLVVAKIALTSDDIRIGPIVYMAQQCAEKALKTYLIYKKESFKKTHDLAELVNLCAVFDADFLQLLSSANELSPYATKGRYPDSRFILPAVSEAIFAVKEAEKIYDFVYEKMDMKK